ncbi:M48 metallopeptidase family protein [Photobacterium carnosum]|uniref:Metal-dependent hydrolase n=1 Tax=Photobacterium carnosum TaxID=2023717 RepID=A0A2N4UQR7_9GAMM|nr:YgjP-like metallopeptidase domain-containing protein [Photobacterium carnosum]PLC57359.1 metal-dependent hydrolase [Photobacterium carnosum]
MTTLVYLSGYSPQLLEQVQQLIETKKLGEYLTNKYPEKHNITTEKTLYNYIVDLQRKYIKKTPVISKVAYDKNIHSVHNALGLHTFVSRIQGNNLKAKNEIRIARVFRSAPLAFLRMITIHELAHLKEKDHNKAFYQLCCHMEPNYHQLELDMRLYLTHLDLVGSVYN